MCEPTIPPPPREDTTDDHDDVLWVPPEQPPKHASLRVEDGTLSLFATCDDCGGTTRASPELHLFLACSHCDGEITLAWAPAEA